MNQRFVSRLPLVLLLGTLAALAPLNSCRADRIVAQGWDLLQTEPGTNFMGIPFIGVPVSSFDFGGTAGVRSFGGPYVDTIVQRKADATVANPMIPIELVALQLQSAMPVNLGAGTDFHFITLQSSRGAGDPPPGPASTGQMTVNGLNTDADTSDDTFSSFFDVFYDIRIGSLNGTIIQSDMLHLETDPMFSFEPQLGDLRLPGINWLLGDGSGNQDFFPVGTFKESHPSATHFVSTANPEPSTLVLAGVGAFSALGSRWRGRKKQVSCPE